jgi:hypothetical protein
MALFDLDDDQLRLGGGCCFCKLFITGVILFAVSFGTLDPTEAGIRYNNNLVEIDTSQIYNNGRYFLGLGLWFIRFPVHSQLIEYTGEFALDAWSKEGQLINLDISFYYRLQRNNLVELYRRYGQGYDAVFYNIGIVTLKSVTIQYTAVDFFTKRREIGARMKSALRARLLEEFATVDFFNLETVDVPDAFEQKILNKVVTNQQANIAVFTKRVNELEAQILLIQAKGTGAVNYTVAKANADASRVTNNAISLGSKYLRSQEAQSYAQLQNALGLSGQKLLAYRWAQLMNKLPDTGPARRNLQFFVGFKQAAIQVQPGG